MRIILTKGKVAIVDEIDSDLSTQSWGAHRDEARAGTAWYAVRRGRMADGCRTARLHRVIVERMIGRPLTKQEEVDHINHNGLDNRRANLRVASHQENMWNRGTHNKNKKSIYRGVTRRGERDMWRARICINGKSVHLGDFTSEIDAAKAFDKAIQRVAGSFSRLNFPENAHVGEIFECQITQ